MWIRPVVSFEMFSMICVRRWVAFFCSTPLLTSPQRGNFAAPSPLTVDCCTLLTPRFSAQGNFGPLVAGTNAEVPLWLARTLKASGKARILVPKWLRLRSLTTLLEEETVTNKEYFSALPFHYAEARCTGRGSALRLPQL